jgi:hypothetical protein
VIFDEKNPFPFNHIEEFVTVLVDMPLALTPGRHEQHCRLQFLARKEIDILRRGTSKILVTVNVELFKVGHGVSWL